MNEQRALYLVFAACVVSSFLIGCADTEKYKTADRICVGNRTKAEAMRTAEDILGQMHFTIDKADAEQGLIRTKPLSGAKFFEFWRKDSVGAFNATEANLHTIRRTVQLEITQQDKQSCIGCNVRVERLSLPEHEVSGTSRAYEMFSRSTASMQELRLRPEQERRAVWLDLGKDSVLATVILQRIEENLKAKTKG
ncbi:MAG: hypothetical protein ACYS76_08200 [Planctomycetota bacterium]|jgi:hypothetical protein